VSERTEAALPDGSPPHNGGEACSPDCKVCSFLEVCEVAFREVANAQLSLSDKEFDLPRVKNHLFAEKCPVCLRCYRNAKRAYARLQHGGLPSPRVFLSSREVVVPEAVERPVVKTMAAKEPGEVHYRVPAVPNGSGLNALAAELACYRTPAAGFEITLVHHPRDIDADGNDLEVLRQFDDYLLTLQVNLKGGRSLPWQPRLGIDDQGSLVSSPFSLREVDPTEIISLQLVSWKKRTDIVP